MSSPESNIAVLIVTWRAGTSGPVTLSFTSNTPYRAGLIGGLALLPLLALLAFLPVRRPPPSDEPPRPWHPGRVTTSVAVVAAAGVISGIVGVSVGGAALGLRIFSAAVRSSARH